MSPSYEALAADNRLSFVTWRVYILLQRHCLSFVEIREVKVWWLADRLGLGETKVSRALTWLAANKYLVEHERGSRGVRRFTLVWTIEPDEAAA